MKYYIIEYTKLKTGSRHLIFINNRDKVVKGYSWSYKLKRWSKIYPILCYNLNADCDRTFGYKYNVTQLTKEEVFLELL